MNAVAKIVTAFADDRDRDSDADGDLVVDPPDHPERHQGDAEEERPADRARRRLPVEVQDDRREQAGDEPGGRRDHPVAVARVAAPGQTRPEQRPQPPPRRGPAAGARGRLRRR